MFLRTERLFLRPPFPEDWRAIYRGVGDEDMVRMLASAPWPYTPADAREFCKGSAGPRNGRFVVTLPTRTGAPVIGTAGFAVESGSAEIGYWIARAYQGRGYATEAVRGLLGLLCALGHRRVVAGHFIDNPASGRVLAKAGFRKTGQIVLARSAGRGGELTPMQRYAIELDGDIPRPLPGRGGMLAAA